MADFGDRVRVKVTPETTASGVAGLEGDVYGFTTPSSTGMQVIGGAPDDYALNVSIEGHGSDLWFRPDLLEFLHHNPGMEMIAGNVRTVRQADGSWKKCPIDKQSG